MRRTLPLGITFIIGTILILSIFIPHKPFGTLGEDFTIFFDIIAVFAFILGGGNLIKVHGNKVYKRVPGWGYSVITVLAFLITLIIGLFKIGHPEGIKGSITASQHPFDYIYQYGFLPLNATMFSMLAFFVASASYRAFRAKNRDAILLLAAAFIILLGRTFIGHVMTAWLPESLSFLKIPELANWIMRYPNLGGQRAIMIGISLGIISTSLKLILGVERTYLGADTK
jgi:hypothetical protein